MGGLRDEGQAMESIERNEPASLLSKVDAILRAFQPEEPELALAELARRTGLAKTTVPERAAARARRSAPASCPPTSPSRSRR
jgi:IclR helix-turn-helix domain